MTCVCPKYLAFGPRDFLVDSWSARLAASISDDVIIRCSESVIGLTIAASQGCFTSLIGRNPVFNILYLSEGNPYSRSLFLIYALDNI